MFRATPVMREVARIELPSTRAATTAARSALLRTFAILNIMPERLGNVKWFVIGSSTKRRLTWYQPIG